MMVCCCGLSILVSFMVARFTFFPYVVFIGGVIVFLFIVISVPRLVGFAVAGVRLIVFHAVCVVLVCVVPGVPVWAGSWVRLRQ